MSNEYLYDKTGSDPAISGLEDLLAAYRIDPVAPKMSRAATDETSVNRSGWFPLKYRLGFALAAIVLAVTMLSLVYLGSSKIEYVANSPKAVPAVDLPIADEVSSVAAVDQHPSTETKLPAARLAVDRHPAKIARRAAPRTFVARNTAPKTPKLTREERYAYDQLMVALWITGSKLRTVQDTINRVDDDIAVTANDKR
jgi:hypothetical protein